MAYTRKEKKEILEKAKADIKADDNILFLDDVIAGMPISKKTFYEWWPKGSDEYNEMWRMINDNRVTVKKYIRLKLRLSGKASELLALYRMICTEDERRAINMNYMELSGKPDSEIKIGFVETDAKPASSEDDVKQ